MSRMPEASEDIMGTHYARGTRRLCVCASRPRGSVLRAPAPSPPACAYAPPLSPSARRGGRAPSGERAGGEGAPIGGPPCGRGGGTLPPPRARPVASVRPAPRRCAPLGGCALRRAGWPGLSLCAAVSRARPPSGAWLVAPPRRGGQLRGAAPRGNAPRPRAPRAARAPRGGWPPLSMAAAPGLRWRARPARASGLRGSGVARCGALAGRGWPWRLSAVAARACALWRALAASGRLCRPLASAPSVLPPVVSSVPRARPRSRARCGRGVTGLRLRAPATLRRGPSGAPLRGRCPRCAPRGAHDLSPSGRVTSASGARRAGRLKVTITRNRYVTIITM